ncbi:hypothetical protein sos41_28750 [Alphaproteobacteria bacterium SO-S41]|nr:hypothetical protein sos41_28750 [Alphaproteobacteria bacterium SO-S41]
MSQPVFVSYATADRAQALAVCEAIEARGIACWIATRDVAPGENYQEAIVQSLRAARAMVLVFSAAANDSDEIKKELSLASRFRVPVMALRIEDVEPSDAFAYELSTRQWINAFEGWDRAIDALAARIEQIAGAAPTPARGRSAKAFSLRRPMAIAAAGLAVLSIAGAAWWGLQSPSPSPAPEAQAAHSMTVRLAGFQLLSADLPATVPATVDAEIAAAFNADGVVGVSTAPAPAPGEAPAYALGGTIQRDGDMIRVITRLTNERSGTTIWTDSFNYDGNEVSRVPRRIAVDAGNVVRCGLFGASTYHAPLPDSVLKDYMQFCQGHWDTRLKEGRKALLPAQRVVAAVPDFSWGWAAVAGGYWKVSYSAETPEAVDAARAAGREAADRAVEIDPKNSEAFYIKAMLVDRQDWGTREALFKRAVAAQRLDCGCEYHQYGWLLVNVGRVNEGVERLRQASDMLALYLYTALNLADALVVARHLEEAARVYDAAIDLAPDAAYAARIKSWKATRIWDAAALRDPQVALPPELRAALVKGYDALTSGEAGAKAEAVQALLALPQDQQGEAATRLLASLGATREAFQMATPLVAKAYPGPTLFWHPSMRATLDDPGFPALAEKLGLMKYWKATGTRPDVCNEATPPAFCGMI